MKALFLIVLFMAFGNNSNAQVKTERETEVEKQSLKN